MSLRQVKNTVTSSIFRITFLTGTGLLQIGLRNNDFTTGLYAAEQYDQNESAKLMLYLDCEAPVIAQNSRQAAKKAQNTAANCHLFAAKKEQKCNLFPVSLAKKYKMQSF